MTDLVTGVVHGVEKVDTTRRRAPSAARAAFRDELLRALLRPPCLVSFSGGRDSSALLALATHVARAEGLPLPIPATLVFGDDAASDESEYQKEVLDQLDLDEWVRFFVTDELDVVGPVAGPLLRRHGLLWPFNTHMHAPIIAAAAGGSVVTGFGGDEMGNASATARTAQLLTRRRKPHPVDALVLGYAVSPRPLRRAVETRREARVIDSACWLTAHAKRQVARDRGRYNVDVPASFARRVESWWLQTRYRATCIDSFSIVGDDHNVRVFHPFASETVAHALAAEGGYGGYGTRTDLLRRVFGDLMPVSVSGRLTKASFSNPLFAQHAQAFARSWDGSGLDRQWVDVERLQEHWRAGDPDVRTLSLLQTAWLATQTSAT